MVSNIIYLINPTSLLKTALYTTIVTTHFLSSAICCFNCCLALMSANLFSLAFFTASSLSLAANLSLSRLWSSPRLYLYEHQQYTTCQGYVDGGGAGCNYSQRSKTSKELKGGSPYPSPSRETKGFNCIWYLIIGNTNENIRRGIIT